MNKFDVCIIGGGAAGLATAASLDNGLRVCILEKNEIPGRKILATGGGRCNITNEACENKVAALDFFASLGLECYCDEEGRYFPYTNRAADVVRVLTGAIKPGTVAEYAFEVQDIVKTDKEFCISGVSYKRGEKLKFYADTVVLAAGGKAAPQLGTTGDGYRFAKMLGHSVTRVFPILTGLECRCDGLDFLPLKGIRARASVKLLKDGKVIPGLSEQRGEVQFTDRGLSGICVFNLTPHIRAEDDEKPAEALRRYEISVNFAPDIEAGRLNKRTSAFGILTAELAEAADRIMSREGRTVDFIRDWRFSIASVRGWRDAQCSCGGVPLSEVCADTQESKIIPGLYLAGELLDSQGPCGGFNLQNAWETGIRAAADINMKGQKK